MLGCIMRCLRRRWTRWINLCLGHSAMSLERPFAIHCTAVHVTLCGTHRPLIPVVLSDAPVGHSPRIATASQALVKLSSTTSLDDGLDDGVLARSRLLSPCSLP